MENLTLSELQNLTQIELQNLVKSILSNPVLTEKQVTTVHLINELELNKSKVSEKQIEFNKKLENKMKEAKDECSKRIFSYDGRTRSFDEWILKSQNLQDFRATYIDILSSGGSPTQEQISNYNLANTIIDRKNQLLNKYEALKNKILSCKTIQELDLIIVRSDVYWTYQSLEIIKTEKRKLVDDLYAKALILQIENGFTFQIDLRSKYGAELLNIITNSIGSYADEFKSKQVITFFVNIEENNKQKQIYCACYNWIWQYIFEELLFYVKSTKQLKESYISTIENIDYKDLKELQFEFPKPDGVKINVSNTIKELLNITNDASTDGNKIVVPDYVKEAIRRVNRELFRYTKEDDIKNNINKLLENSWLS